MKFDVFSWDEIKTNGQIKVGKGVLRLQVSAPSALFLEAQGVETLAGYGTSFDVEVAEDVKVRVEAPKGARAFLFRPAGSTAVQPIGEVYTNADRMPNESGAYAEVTRARREFELERRSMLRELRSEGEKMRKELKALRGSDETPLDAASDVIDVEREPGEGPAPEPVKTEPAPVPETKET